jgi:thiol-disulfide isomerase/thioredoxin
MSNSLTDKELVSMQQNLPPKNIIIIKFTAEWCGPCQNIKSLCESYVKNLPDSIIFYEIDIEESLELYMKLKSAKMVNGIPALLAYKDGPKDFWYVPDDSHLGGNQEGVKKFFERCLKYVN